MGSSLATKMALSPCAAAEIVLPLPKSSAPGLGSVGMFVYPPATITLPIASSAMFPLADALPPKSVLQRHESEGDSFTR